MKNNLLINGFSNVGKEGVTLHFNQKVSLNGRLSADEWWLSWDKIGKALFPDKYSDESSVAGRREIRGESQGET